MRRGSNVSVLLRKQQLTQTWFQTDHLALGWQGHLSMHVTEHQFCVSCHQFRHNDDQSTITLSRTETAKKNEHQDA